MPGRRRYYICGEKVTGKANLRVNTQMAEVEAITGPNYSDSLPLPSRDSDGESIIHKIEEENNSLYRAGLRKILAGFK